MRTPLMDLNGAAASRRRLQQARAEEAARGLTDNARKKRSAAQRADAEKSFAEMLEAGDQVEESA